MVGGRTLRASAVSPMSYFAFLSNDVIAFPRLVRNRAEIVLRGEHCRPCCPERIFGLLG
jgi:hypothetical protein